MFRRGTFSSRIYLQLNSLFFSKDVTTWDASDAEWFKIQEGGYDATKGWAATTQLYAANSVVDVTIPAQLKAGQYLLRHEIIALHAAFSYPGAQGMLVSSFDY